MVKMPIFLHFVGAGVLFDGGFSMWVSVSHAITSIWNLADWMKVVHLAHDSARQSHTIYYTR